MSFNTVSSSVLALGAFTMHVAPPLYPSAHEIKSKELSFEIRCKARYDSQEISKSFDIVKSYISRSPEFGLIVRFDLKHISRHNDALIHRFMCWIDPASGDFVTALSLGQQGERLP